MNEKMKSNFGKAAHYPPALRRIHSKRPSVRRNGAALQYADESVRADRLVVHAAVAQHSAAMRWATKVPEMDAASDAFGIPYAVSTSETPPNT